MTDKMREEFENGVCDLLDLNKNWNKELGCYTTPKTDNYFLIFECGWLRSRAALCVELPKQWFDDGLGCDLMEVNHVADALDAAGVRYK